MMIISKIVSFCFVIYGLFLLAGTYHLMKLRHDWLSATGHKMAKSLFIAVFSMVIVQAWVLTNDKLNVHPLLKISTFFMLLTLHYFLASIRKVK